MSDERQPVEIRVEQSLRRIGFGELKATYDGEGKITLTGTLPSSNDIAIAVATARSVAGVSVVKSELRT